MAAFLLAIYIALLFVRPMDWWPPVLGWQLVNVAAIGTLFAASPRLLREAGHLWKTFPELAVGVAFVIGVSLSWLPRFWLTGMRTAFQDFGKIYILLFLIVVFARDPKGYRAIIWTLLFCSIFMSVQAMRQIHTGYGFGNTEPIWRVRDFVTGEGVYQARAFGIFEDPNDLCMIFIMSIPLFYAEFRSASGPLLKVTALAGIPSVAYAAWLTNSRGGYLSIFAMLVSYQVSRIKGFKRWALLGLSVVLLTVLAPSRFGSASMREQDRSKLWGDGIAMFKAHILFGVGAGQFSDVQEDHKVAHNTYVNILAETGVVGYMPYFLLLYFCFVHFRRVMNLGTLVEASDRIQMAGLYSAAVGCFTAMYFLSRQTSLVSYIILGLMTAKAAGACKTPDLFQRVFVQSAKEYRKGLLWGLGSIVFMWITIRIVNATG